MEYMFRNDGALFCIERPRKPTREDTRRFKREARAAGYVGLSVPLTAAERSVIALMGLPLPALAAGFAD